MTDLYYTSRELALALTLLWVVLMILILFLNLPVGFLFWSSEQLASPRNMYITSMIVSDLLLALLIPFKIYLIHAEIRLLSCSWVICRAIMVVQSFLVFASVYSILALALVRHRYIITHHRISRQTRREAGYFIVFFWIASLVSSLRVQFLVKTEEGEERAGFYSAGPNLGIYDTVVNYGLPFTTIFLLCAHAQCHSSKSKVAMDPMEGAASKRLDNRVVKMVILISVFFVLFQLPAKVLAVVEHYKQVQYTLLHEVFELLLFCTGASNIIIYVAFNRRAASMFITFITVATRWSRWT